MLAWKIAYPIRKDLSVEKAKEGIFLEILANAKATDAQDGTADSTQSDDLLVVR
jgi:hypothetical protein